MYVESVWSATPPDLMAGIAHAQPSVSRAGYW